MKKFIKPASLVFLFLSSILFFILGMAYAGFSGAATGQGLAAGAIVVFYGFVFAFITFIAALFIVYYLPARTILISNRILLIAFVIIAGILTYRILTKERTSTPSKELPPTVPPLLNHTK